jgi:kynureninase
MSFLPSSFQSFPLGFTLEAAKELDKEDPLAWFREKFYVPLGSDGHSEKIYLCGNSLGLMPKATEKLINEELTVWKRKGVDGHFEHDFGRPWVTIDEPCLEPMAKIVGAKAMEIAIMGSLTSNLHLLMVSFYSPTPTRYKIMMESNAFPSDRFALESQIRFHGFDPKDALIIVSSSSEAGILKFEDVQRTLEEQGEKIALIMIGLVIFGHSICLVNYINCGLEGSITILAK